MKTWFIRIKKPVEVVRHGGSVLGGHDHEQVLLLCGGGLQN